MATLGCEVVPVDPTTLRPVLDADGDGSIDFDHFGTTNLKLVDRLWRQHPTALVAAKRAGRWWLLGAHRLQRDPFTDVLRYFTDDALGGRLLAYNSSPAPPNPPHPAPSSRPTGSQANRADFGPHGPDPDPDPGPGVAVEQRLRDFPTPAAALTTEGAQPAWSRIDPDEDRGIIDYIRLRLDVREVDEEDLDGLAGHGLAERSQRPAAEMVEAGKRIRFGARTVYFRVRDGVEVVVRHPRKGRHGSVTVGGALPRIVRPKHRHNQGVGAVTPQAAMEGIRSITEGLFPRSTAGAGTRGWVVTGMDLAVNFAAPVAMVVEGYRLARTPRVLAVSTTFGFQTVQWSVGRDYKLHIYSRDLKTAKDQHGRGASFDEEDSESLDYLGEAPFEPWQISRREFGASRLGRVEVQLRSARRLAYLFEVEGLADVDRNAPRLRVAVEGGDEKVGVRVLPMSYPHLHAVLRHEVSLLEPTVQLAEPIPEHPKVQQTLAAIAIAQNPGLLELLTPTNSDARKELKRAASIRRWAMTRDLLSLCWPNHHGAGS